MAMTRVSEIETVDNEYCFSLRDPGGQDFVLFGFATEAEAEIARKAIGQIVQRASVIVPIAPGPPAAADKPGDSEDGGEAPEDANENTAPTSPFSK
jgi:hypothetical protein